MSRLPVPPPAIRRTSSSGKPLPVPLRPDASAIHDNSMRSLVRGVIALGRNALNPSVPPDDFARKTWPHDRNVSLSCALQSRPR